MGSVQAIPATVGAYWNEVAEWDGIPALCPSRRACLLTLKSLASGRVPCTGDLVRVGIANATAWRAAYVASKGEPILLKQAALDGVPLTAEELSEILTGMNGRYHSDVKVSDLEPFTQQELLEIEARIKDKTIRAK